MKLFKIFLFLFIIIFFLIWMFNSATAGVKYDPIENRIIVLSNEDIIDFPWLYDQIKNDSILSHDGTVWYLNAEIYLSNNSKMNINPESGCTKLILGNSPRYGKLQYGQPFYINNIEITGGREIGTNARFHDVKIRDADGIRLDQINEDVYNIEIEDLKTGLKFSNSNNISIYNISITNTEGTGISCYDCDYIDIFNVNIKNAGDYTNPKTGHFGIIFNGGSTYSSAHDIFIDGTGWSSIEATDKTTHDISFYNITVHNSGHNGLDLHGGYNHRVNNMTVYNSVSNNYLVVFSKNVILSNINSYDAGWDRGLSVAEYSDNFTAINYYCENANQALIAFHIEDLKIINMTSVNTEYGINFATVKEEPVINGTIIDANFINTDKHDLWVRDAINSKFINVDYESILCGNSKPKITFYYYYDIIVKDEHNSPISNAKIKFTNEVSSSFPSINSYGDDKTTFYTTSEGRTLLPNQDRTNSPALAKNCMNSGHDSFSYTADITAQDGRTVSLTGISAGSSWYRPDSATSTYTITTIIADYSTGPDLIGFAPSEDNPFNTSEYKTFQVWVDERLDNMNWYVDDNLVLEGSLSYRWTQIEGIHTIKFEGSNDHGTIKKYWEIDNEPFKEGSKIKNFFRLILDLLGII